MKKFTVFLLSLIGIILLSGCYDGGEFTEKAYSNGGIEKITVQAEDRELEISPSEDGLVYIDYFDGEKEYLDISVSQSKELTVKLIYNKIWTDFIGAKPSQKYRKIKIRVPDDLIVSLSASTTNENIRITALSVKESITLESNGGNILCERVSIGKTINLTAKNGNITGTVLGGWDDFSISCKIKKGDCNLPLNKENGEKSFTADCNNGNINIGFVK